MNPEIWGPSGWIFLHTITFNYPINPTPEQKIKHKELFENLSYTLPCARCAQHYLNNLKKYSLDNALETRDKLINWLIDIHNEVNKKNGKRIYSYDEVKKIYSDMYSIKNNQINWNIILIFIIIILISFYIYKEYF
tara:strand:+ start:340 stop:747 length:408 start_codon:yes stop_codon:yes gene_type:complete